MDIPGTIKITRQRAIELALKHRSGDEPLPETVQRILERFDAITSSNVGAATTYDAPPEAAIGTRVDVQT
ncbi:MAG: hypothetical protein AAGE65_07000 [Planctomycetota bacterium]